MGAAVRHTRKHGVFWSYQNQKESQNLPPPDATADQLSIYCTCASVLDCWSMGTFFAYFGLITELIGLIGNLRVLLTTGGFTGAALYGDIAPLLATLQAINSKVAIPAALAQAICTAIADAVSAFYHPSQTGTALLASIQSQTQDILKQANAINTAPPKSTT